MIRWRRVMFIALVAGGITATAILTPVAFFAYQTAARAVVRPIPATDVEQRDILRVLLETQEYSGIPLPPPGYGTGEPEPKEQFLVFIDRTLAICADAETVPAGDDRCPPWSRPLHPAEIDPNIPERLVRELMAGNREARMAAVPDLPALVVANQAEIEALLDSGSWKAFYTRYPDSTGLLRTTRAVLSADRSRALIYAEYYCDGVCGTGTLHYLKRAGDSWTIERNFRYWIS